jgi:predicted TPR repeat methyltransferase
VQRGESQRYLEQPEAAIESFNRAIAVLEQRSLVSGGVGQSDEYDDSESSDTDEDEDAEATAALLEHARHCVAMTLAMVKETRGGALSDAPAPPSRCANGYVSGLFDRFAATFDERLVAELHYVGHELVANAARRSVRGDGELALRAARGELRVLDLGAGTGLCGKLVSDWSKSTTGKLVGVDLSPKMLALAAALGVYDELVVAEVTAWCVAHAAKSGSAAKQAHAPPAVPPAEEETQAPAAAALVVDFCRPFDIVLAADTVIYFGALGELFAAVGNLLAQNGRFIFSCEAGKSAEGEEESAADAACRDGWELQGSGRYVHSRACVLGAARRCGLVLESSESALMRIENGVEVFAEIYCVRL